MTEKSPSPGREIHEQPATRSTTGPEVSVVVPLYNESESLGPLVAAVEKALEGFSSFEIILVDDGSTDQSWQQICELGSSRSYLKGIRFRRNHGKSAALNQGFRMASGCYVATMDADLQDDPLEIPPMIAMMRDENLDLVSGWKKERFDPLSKTIPSRFFNYVTSLATGIKLNDFNCGLKVYRREVTKELALYGELHRYIPYLAKQIGYERIGEKVVQHHPRRYGVSKFGFSRFLKGFLDLTTLLFLGHYMKRPMHFFGGLGTLFLLVGGAVTLYLTFMRLFFEMYLSGRPLFIFGVVFLLLGVQFFSIGFLGELINQNRIQQYGDAVRIAEILNPSSEFTTSESVSGSVEAHASSAVEPVEQVRQHQTTTAGRTTTGRSGDTA